MNRKALLQYKKTRVSTTSRERILLMLYDGAIRFVEQARRAIEEGQAHIKGEKISRAHAIISELNSTLNHEAAPELCDNLQALYIFMLEKLTQANRNNDVEALAVVTDLLNTLRDGWQEVVQQQQQKQTSSGKPTRLATSVSVAAAKR
ncbi:MAG: flagellar export chaperone FliS [Myxococcota bacterium]